MAVLDITEGVLTLDVGPLQHDLARRIPGLTYHSRTDLWAGTAAWSTALAAHAEFQMDLTLSPSAVDWWERMAGWEQWAAGIKTWQPSVVLPWTQNLRPLQTTGVGFLTASTRALLADDPGAGKGVMVATALGLLPDSEYPALIICPKSVKWTHARHLEVWGAGVTPHVIAGDARKRRDQIATALSTGGRNVLIMNYEQVREHSFQAPYGSVQRTDKEKEPKELNSVRIPTVVVDEAHRTADPKAKTTRAVWALTHQANRVWMTTGTPVPSPIGFWSIMHGLVPNEAPSRVKYQDRFCLTETIHAKGGREVSVVRAFNPRAQAELDRWVAPYLLRRTLDEIEPDLPPVVNKTMYVEMSGKQATAYRMMEKEMMAETPSGIIAATDPMQQSLRLLQLASALPVFESFEDDEGEVHQRLVEMAMPSSKVDGVMDWLTDNPGKQVVVFAVSRKLIELVGRRLESAKIAHAFITGTQNEAHRRAAEAALQDRDVRVLLGTYGAMSEGITLTAASTQLMLQRSFKLIENVQADGRCRRIGQDASHVDIIEVVSANTYDEDVFESGAYKEETAQALLKDPGWIRKKLEARVVA